jgi:hypothetical protein
MPAEGTVGAPTCYSWYVVWKVIYVLLVVVYGAVGKTYACLVPFVIVKILCSGA